MVAVLARDPKNKTSSSPTSSRCTTVASRIKSWKEGARRALAKSFCLTKKALSDVLHGVTSKPLQPATKQASPTSTSFIGAGTQQPQFITLTTHEDERQDPSTTASSGVPGGPGFITLTTHEHERQDSSTTASSGVPGGPGHSTSTTASSGVPGGPGHPTFKILVQHHINMLKRRNETIMIIPVQQAIYFEQPKSFYFEQHDFLLPMALLD